MGRTVKSKYPLEGFDRELVDQVQRGVTSDALLSLDHTHRAMIAAQTTLSDTEAAHFARVGRTTVRDARQIRRDYPDQWEKLKTGEIGIGTLAKNIRHPTRQQDMKARTEAKLELHSQLWENLHTALKLLASMPLAEDVARVVLQNHSRTRFVTTTLRNATNWIGEFSHEFTEQQAAKNGQHSADPHGAGNKAPGGAQPGERADAPDAGDAGAGDQAPGEQSGEPPAQ